MPRRTAHFFLSILAAAILLSAGSFALARMQATIRMLQEDNAFLAQALQKKQDRLDLAKKRDVIQNLGTRYWFEQPPMFIFRERFVPWSTFTRFLPEHIDASRLKPLIAGRFFPIFDASGASSSPTASAEGIHFPSDGEYGLYTSLGTFRILIQDPQASRDDALMAIARFVARNTVHSNADHAQIMDQELRRVLMGKLFLSDQPLALWCAESSMILSDVLRAMGYETRILSLDGPRYGGHGVLEAYFPDRKKWGMLDTDYGTFLADAESGTILSMKEAAERLAKDPAQVSTGFLAHKKTLDSAFNLTAYTPHFVWRTENLGGPMTTPDAYPDMMQDLSARISVFKIRKQPPQ
ncbi:MAG TPA: hypothetical protein DCW68_00560 [Rhodospirillaceae bacterium]|nr:hypothetical protein [Rhodospirillaceae bacterium]